MFPCQLLFGNLSPIVALSRFRFVVQVVYIDESDGQWKYLSEFFGRCSNIMLRCARTAADAVPFPSHSIIIVRHPDDNDGVVSNAVATIRCQSSVSGVSVLAYMDQPSNIDKADAVFRTFSTGNEVASHVLHMLVLKHNGVLLWQHGFRSF